MMSRTQTVGPALLALSLVCLPAPGAAQEAATPASRPAAPSPGIDVDRLPIDLHRIERQLRRTSEREERDGLQLRYFVDVFGTAPRLQLFAPEVDLRTGPTPWGAPTHRDMIEFTTPQEFRSPPMDFNALARWLSDRLTK